MSQNRDLKQNSPFILRDSINDLFDNFFSFPAAYEKGSLKNLAMDVTEDDKAYHISAEMPGVKQEDIEVNLDRQQLTIKAKRHAQHEDKKKHLQECFYGEYQRTLTVPEHVKAEEIVAKCTNGVLNITLPKAEDTVHIRKIAVTNE